MSSCNGPIYDRDIVDPNIKGDVTLDGGAIIAIVDQILPELWPRIEDSLADWLAQAHVKLTVDQVEIVKELILGDEAKNKLADLLEEMFTNGTLVIRGATIIETRLNACTFDLDTINTIMQGLLSPGFIESLATAIITSAKLQIINTLDGTTLNNVVHNGGSVNGVDIIASNISNSTISNSTIDGLVTFDSEFLLSADAKLSLITEMRETIEDAVQKAMPKACDGEPVGCRLIVTCDIFEAFESWVREQIESIIEWLREIDRELEIIREKDREQDDRLDNMISDIVTCDGSKLGTRPLVACDQQNELKVSIENAVNAYFPVGMFAYFNTNNTFAHWFICKGDLLHRNTAPRLYDWLVANGHEVVAANVVRMPDGRGCGLRMRNLGRFGDVPEYSINQYGQDTVQMFQAYLNQVQFAGFAGTPAAGDVQAAPYPFISHFTSDAVPPGHGVFNLELSNRFSSRVALENAQKSLTSNLFIYAGEFKI